MARASAAKQRVNRDEKGSCRIEISVRNCVALSTTFFPFPGVRIPLLVGLVFERRFVPRLQLGPRISNEANEEQSHLEPLQSRHNEGGRRSPQSFSNETHVEESG